MLNTALILAAAEGHHHAVNELPIPPVWYGIIVFLLFMAGLAACMSMRSVGLRPQEPTSAVQRHGASGSHSAGH